MISLRADYFKRNKRREKSVGDVFNKASKGLNKILSMVLAIFFTPVLMATSLFSQEIVLMAINLTLFLGNVTNFLYRIYKRDIGKAELAVSLIGITAFAALAYVLFPPIGVASSLLSVFALVNQVAVGINLFFLFRNIIIPPMLRFMNYIGGKLGFKNEEKYHQVEDLQLDKDAHVVNFLMHRHFGHGLNDKNTKADLQKLNKLLQVLNSYLNKYDEQVLGEVKYKDLISAVEDHIKQLTTKGNGDSSFSFIKQKIAYKEVKLARLQEAKSDLAEEKPVSWQKLSKYCKGVTEKEYNKEANKFFDKAKQMIDEEISHQIAKIDNLSSCLP